MVHYSTEPVAHRIRFTCASAAVRHASGGGGIKFEVADWVLHWTVNLTCDKRTPALLPIKAFQVNDQVPITTQE